MYVKNIFLLSCILMFVFFSSHANDKYSFAANSNNSDTSVETKVPNSNYKPAFKGETRIDKVKTSTPYNVEKIAEKLGPPFAIVGMPDGRLMVTIKSGYAEIHDANGKLIKKITGFPPVVFEGQGGLLDIAFDPNFASNKTTYWTFSESLSSR